MAKKYERNPSWIHKNVINEYRVMYAKSLLVKKTPPTYTGKSTQGLSLHFPSTNVFDWLIYDLLSSRPMRYEHSQKIATPKREHQKRVVSESTLKFDQSISSLFFFTTVSLLASLGGYLYSLSWCYHSPKKLIAKIVKGNYLGPMVELALTLGLAAVGIQFFVALMLSAFPSYLCYGANAEIIFPLVVGLVSVVSLLGSNITVVLLQRWLFPAGRDFGMHKLDDTLAKELSLMAPSSELMSGHKLSVTASRELSVKAVIDGVRMLKKLSNTRGYLLPDEDKEALINVLAYLKDPKDLDAMVTSNDYLKVERLLTDFASRAESSKQQLLAKYLSAGAATLSNFSSNKIGWKK